MIRNILNLIPHYTVCREGGIPYMTRYYLLGGPRRKAKWFPFNLYLHCFHTSDEPVPHNHPWKKAWSLILRGEYLEFRPATGNYVKDYIEQLPRVKEFRPGMVNSLEADDFHFVELITDEVWTLFLSGPRVQRWGFNTEHGFMDSEEYIKTKPGAKTTRM